MVATDRPHTLVTAASSGISGMPGSKPGTALNHSQAALSPQAAYQEALPWPTPNRTASYARPRIRQANDQDPPRSRPLRASAIGVPTTPCDRSRLGCVRASTAVRIRRRCGWSSAWLGPCSM
jgi:hypothetical protein